MAKKRKITWLEGLWESGMFIMIIIFVPICLLVFRNTWIPAVVTGIVFLLIGLWQAWRIRTGRDGLI